MKPEIDLKIYDVETTLKKHVFLSGVVYSFKKDSFENFLHPESLGELRDSLNGSYVVTFNGLLFDSKVVLGKSRRIIQYSKTDCYTVFSRGFRWTEFDLFAFVKSRVLKTQIDNSLRRFSPGGLSLNKLSKINLKDKKQNISDSPEKMYKKKNFEKLLTYNKQDVSLTKNLFELIVKKNKIFTGKGDALRTNPLLHINYFKFLK